jgi:ADP-ribosylglycohydrolase
MRMAAIGWTIDARNRALHEAAKSAQVTPNRPQGAKGEQRWSEQFHWPRWQRQRQDRRLPGRSLRLRLFDAVEPASTPRRIRCHVPRDSPAAAVSFLEPTDLEHAARKTVSPDADTLACTPQR